MATDLVSVDPTILPELIEKILLKREDVEKELEGLGKAPKGIKDIFHQCRGFEKAFTTAVDSVDISSQIRRTFNSTEGLSGSVDSLPVEERFKLANVKAVCREADGFQPHLVSPEFGLRRLVEDAMGLVLEPTTTAVRRVHLLLIEATRQASRKAGKFSEDGTFDDKKTSQLPMFEKAILTAAQRFLEEWKDQSLASVSTLVAMEQDFVTAAFFRHAIAQRSLAMQQQDQMHDIFDNGEMRPADDDDDESDAGNDDDDESTEDGSESPAAQRQMSSLNTQRPAASSLGSPAQEDEFKMGYLEKRIGEHSGRQNLPESWKWQKRWFVMTDAKGMLYYFKTADDPPNYRGVINIKQCKVEDMDSEGNVRAAGRGRATEDSGSMLIKLSHIDPSKALIKKHYSLVLRAESPAEKYSWMLRLKRCAEGPGAYVAPPSRAALAAPPAGGAKKGPPPSMGSLGPPQQGYQQGPMPLDKESFMNGKLGLGMAIPEDATAKLGPLPALPTGARQSGREFEDPDTSSYDAWLEQLAEDTKQYVFAVFKTLVATVPKAIIHTQVKMAQENLLQNLYTYATHLNPLELEAMLNEDPELMQKRAAAQMAVKDMNAHVVALRREEDRYGQTAEEDRPERIDVSKEAVTASGMWDLLPEGRPQSPYGDYTPRSLQGKKTAFTDNGGGRSSAPRSSSAAPATTPKPRRRPPPAPPGR